jgi:hypothetical protein
MVGKRKSRLPAQYGFSSPARFLRKLVPKGVWGGDRFVTGKNFAFLAGRRGAVGFAPFFLKMSFCEFCDENN